MLTVIKRGLFLSMRSTDMKSQTLWITCFPPSHSAAGVLQGLHKRSCEFAAVLLEIHVIKQ